MAKSGPLIPDLPALLPEQMRGDQRAEHRPAIKRDPAHFEAKHDELGQRGGQARPHPLAEAALKATRALYLPA